MGDEVSLGRFLAESGLELYDVYDGKRTWTDLRVAAGLPVAAPGPHDEALLRAVWRLTHVDDVVRLRGYRDLLEISPEEIAGLPERERRLARMLIATLGDQVLERGATLTGAGIFRARRRVSISRWTERRAPRTIGRFIPESRVDPASRGSPTYTSVVFAGGSAMWPSEWQTLRERLAEAWSAVHRDAVSGYGRANIDVDEVAQKLDTLSRVSSGSYRSEAAAAAVYAMSSVDHLISCLRRVLLLSGLPGAQIDQHRITVLCQSALLELTALEEKLTQDEPSGRGLPLLASAYSSHAQASRESMTRFRAASAVLALGGLAMGLFASWRLEVLAERGLPLVLASGYFGLSVAVLLAAGVSYAAAEKRSRMADGLAQLANQAQGIDDYAESLAGSAPTLLKGVYASRLFTTSPGDRRLSDEPLWPGPEQWLKATSE